jgi:hypothetical protein
MINILRTTLKLLLICVVVLLPFNRVWSGDEELITPYSELDPETGFYITKSKPATEDSGQNKGISSTPAAQETTNTAGDISSVSPSQVNKFSLIVVGIIVVLLGGFGYRFYRVKRFQ